MVCIESYAGQNGFKGGVFATQILQLRASRFYATEDERKYQLRLGVMMIRGMQRCATNLSIVGRQALECNAEVSCLGCFMIANGKQQSLNINYKLHTPSDYDYYSPVSAQVRRQTSHQ